MGNKVQDKFELGSEWLFIKIYGSPNIIEEIIKKEILRLSDRVRKFDNDSKFFFIRYQDPDYHLRLRFNVNKQKNLFEVINLLQKVILKYNDISLVQYETYKREVRRYGKKNIVSVEKLFYYDSVAIIAILNIKFDNHQTLYKTLYGLELINFYFKLFDIDLDERINYIEEIILSNFKIEFGLVDSKFTKLIAKKYKDNRGLLLNFYNQGIPETLMINNIIYANINAQKILAKSIKVEGNLLLLISDLIHMSLNRLFTYDSRLSEMLTYSLSLKFYKEIKNNPHLNLK